MEILFLLFVCSALFTKYRSAGKNTWIIYDLLMISLVLGCELYGYFFAAATEEYMYNIKAMICGCMGSLSIYLYARFRLKRREQVIANQTHPLIRCYKASLVVAIGAAFTCIAALSLPLFTTMYLFFIYPIVGAGYALLMTGLYMLSEARRDDIHSAIIILACAALTAKPAIDCIFHPWFLNYNSLFDDTLTTLSYLTDFLFAVALYTLLTVLLRRICRLTNGGQTLFSTLAQIMFALSALSELAILIQRLSIGVSYTDNIHMIIFASGLGLFAVYFYNYSKSLPSPPPDELPKIIV